MKPGSEIDTEGSATSDYFRKLEELVKLLELENQALKNRDFEYISDCTRQKESMLQNLEKLDIGQLEFLRDAGPASSTEVGEKEKITSLVKKCHDLNTVNGGIIEISKQFNQRMLNTVLGANPQEENVYDASGSNSGNNPGQVVAKI